MVEIANKTTAMVKKGPENAIYFEKAAAVIPAPSAGIPSIITTPPTPP